MIKKLETHQISPMHESLDNLTPKDVYLGQGEKIKKIREIIKQNYLYNSNSTKIYMRIEFYQIAKKFIIKK